MTPQDMTTEQRLQQIEILLSTAAKTINRTAERSERNTEAIERLSEEGLTLGLAIGRLSEMFTESVGIIRQQQANIERVQVNIERIQVDIERIQSEIRGLQVENQRIIQRVFGENTID